jgi:AraC-like DNA-binding protein
MPARAAHYRHVAVGVERLAAHDAPRHHHREGYANVVLAGEFVESSFAGHRHVGPGDVLLHGGFDAHANFARSRGPLTLLRLPWRAVGLEGVHRVADPDHLAGLVERDVEAAIEALAAGLRHAPPADGSWPERLACALRMGRVERLAHWAEEEGLAPETVSRQFGRLFGVSPQRFRLECRARRAWLACLGGAASLTALAHELGFADLAHMSRSVVALTGRTPSAWRQRVKGAEAGLLDRLSPAYSAAMASISSSQSLS